VGPRAGLKAEARRKIICPSGIKPWSVQSIIRLYTDCTTAAPFRYVYYIILGVYYMSNETAALFPFCMHVISSGTLYPVMAPCCGTITITSRLPPFSKVNPFLSGQMYATRNEISHGVTYLTHTI
jgi:hypothetical protein